MSIVYCIDIPSTAITVAVDVVEFQPADDHPLEIVAAFLFQTTDFGDAAEEILPLQIIRGFTTSGSVGGTAGTPRPLRRDGTAQFVHEVVNTTLASVGTSHVLLTDGWNVRMPYVIHPWDWEEFPMASQLDTTMVLRLPSAPIDSITIRGSVWVREY